eukprot:gene44629-55533_t
MHVCEKENVSYEMSGLEAIIFIAEGDMRNALNALQSTVSGFGSHVTSENVFKVCDQPQPMKVKVVIDRVLEGKAQAAQDIIISLWSSGYAATDIIQTLFK